MEEVFNIKSILHTRLVVEPLKKGDDDSAAVANLTDVLVDTVSGLLTVFGAQGNIFQNNVS